MAEDEYTTIRIKVSTRDEILKIGKMNDTYDDVIMRLIERVKLNGV